MSIPPMMPARSALGRVARTVAATARRIVRGWRSPQALHDGSGEPQDDIRRTLIESGLFDATFYVSQNPDVRATGLDPLAHFLSIGWQEGRDPHPDFDSSFYLTTNPDVAAARMNPLVHFVLEGKREGRLPHARLPVSAESCGYVPPRWLLPGFNPLTVQVSPALSRQPRLNVLVPGLTMRNLSGGPNTALVLAGRLAQAGIAVRLVTTEIGPGGDTAPLWTHLAHLIGDEVPQSIELADAHDRSVPFAIGEHDVFLATAWWTAQQTKYAIHHTKHQRFVYLIQDYEPLLHAASSSQALALETYGLDYLPVINSHWLYEFLVAHGVGRFAGEQFAREALVFEPAVDRALFHPREHERVEGRRRLLFYARPKEGLRNLFELGVAALQKAVHDGAFRADEWQFVGMGEPFAPVPLGHGAILEPAPWLDLPAYAARMRESDILLSLMLSPHPSYPPLEMAASGGLVVTTAYENKSTDSLAEMSSNILAAAPTVEAIAGALVVARGLVADWARRLDGARIDAPRTWGESLAHVVPPLVARLTELGLSSHGRSE